METRNHNSGNGYDRRNFRGTIFVIATNRTIFPRNFQLEVFKTLINLIGKLLPTVPFLKYPSDFHNTLGHSDQSSGRIPKLLLLSAAARVSWWDRVHVRDSCKCLSSVGAARSPAFTLEWLVNHSTKTRVRAATGDKEETWKKGGKEWYLIETKQCRTR